MPWAVQVCVATAAAVVFVGLDLRTVSFRQAWSSDRARLRRNAAFLVANIVTVAVLGALGHALDRVTPRLLDISRAGAAAVAVDVAGCLVVAEFLNWLVHFVKHKHPRLWRLHSPHHVETQYSTALTLHTHGLEVIVSGLLMRFVLRLCGFSDVALDVFTLVYFTTNLYKHCSAHLSLGPLDAVVVSPAYHRLHHAKNYEGNYGGILTVFDVLFGTAHFPSTEEAWAAPLGCAQPEPFGFADEMLYFFAKK